MMLLDLSFTGFLKGTLQASSVLALLLVARPWLRRWIGSRWLALLWVLILARLLIPFAAETPWGLLSRSNQTSDNFSGTVASVGIIQARTGSPTPTQAQATPPAFKSESVPLSRILAIVWVTGTGFSLAKLGLGLLKTRRLAAQTLPATDSHLLAVFHTITPELRKHITLRITNSGELRAPTLAGIFRPQIWIPTKQLDRLTTNELRHVILHELGHARRYDLLIQGLFALALCMHWFNPLVWLAARYARQDRELACDAWVLARMGEEDPESYGMTLMKMSQIGGSVGTIPGTIAMASNKENLKMRIHSIAGFSPISTWRGLLAIIGTMAGLGLMTTAATTVPEENKGTGLEPIHFRGTAPFVETKVKIMDFTEAGEKQTMAKLAIPRNDQFYPGLIGIYTPEEFAKIVKEVNRKPGVSLLSLPSVTTPLGEKTSVAATREFRYPYRYVRDEQFPYSLTPTEFHTTEVGRKVEIIPKVGSVSTTIDLHLVFEQTDLIGFQPLDAKKPVKLRSELPSIPIFDTRKSDFTTNLVSGQTLIFRTKKNSPPMEGGKPDHEFLWLIVTATYVTPEGKPATEAEMPPPPAIKVLTGISRKEDGPNFIRDPDAPDAGMIDVTGFEKGTEIRSPFSENILKVP